jgi:hypothetical protein
MPVGRAAVLAALCAAVIGGASAAASRGAAGDACGVPDSGTVWVDYGEGSVRPDTRAVLARPGVVVTTSGTALPRYYRAHGAATTYFVLHLPAIVGQPNAPADPAAIQAAADSLFAKAVASSGCATPWIALNELFGSGAATPWSATTAQYRADVLALMQALAAHGAQPALFVSGNPNVAGDAAGWWQQVAAAGTIVYEAYFDAPRAASLGPVMGGRRMRLGMRSVIAMFRAAGIAPERLGIALGFHSGGGQGAGGRQGLQPREAWLRVVKWEALAARQVAADAGIRSVWSWGWGTYGAASADPDKPAAACVYLWARDRALCDGPAAAGAGFSTSLVEGQIVLAPTVQCSLSGGRRIGTADVARLTGLTGDRHAAIDALAARAIARTAVRVPFAKVLSVETGAVRRAFGGSRPAYLQALTQAHATLAMAREVIRDELRRQAIASMLTSKGAAEAPLEWTEARQTRALTTAICRKDDLPGSGDFPRSDLRDVGAVPLAGTLPFLLGDVTPPAPPSPPTATPGAKTVTLAWTFGREADLAGYVVFRSTTPGGPYTPLDTLTVQHPGFVDRTAAAAVPSYYVVRAVDTSLNQSDPSPEVAATPASGIGSGLPAQVGVVAAQPVLPHRREDVERDRVLERLDLVRNVRGERNGVPGFGQELLAADVEAKPALDHRRELLVRMVVLGHDRSPGERDPGNGHRVGVEHPAPDAGAELFDGIVVPTLGLHAAILTRPRLPANAYQAGSGLSCSVARNKKDLTPDEAPRESSVRSRRPTTDAWEAVPPT